jgi:ribonuclease E
MVYVPDGRLSGISRKLPDTERSRLKGILKRLTPEDAGVIIRTAAEGASEEALERDLNRLKAQWEVIDAKAKAGANAPSLIYGEPDLVIRVVRDIFNEDFSSLVVQGADEWDTIDNYVRWVAPDLADRTKKWAEDEDVFEAYRVDEQLAKALDRKVWLPSGGYLVIDRTEAMIVVDVNTGKFTGKGGNLEETVTKNNLEAAEEIVRQLRLRDLGGIIVIDFIDMVLESNRDLVLRRLLECLGRDRTRHQVAEVTSLGLVQMTRKRVGEGLLESFSKTCPECGGSGVILTIDPVAERRPPKPQRPPQPKAPAAAAKGKRGSSAKSEATSEGGTSEAKESASKPARKRRTTKSAEPEPANGEAPAESAETTENTESAASETVGASS